ncbi:MAG: type IV secretory system conjugative DNA transfer family protein [Alphaproteobacteria bacterium]|nr:type IV secretory system conjugative DNA transfer family protein [Alphaproteobacteria bacterium]
MANRKSLTAEIDKPKQGPSPRLPESLSQPGLLVGWSLERDHIRQPIGFSFGNPLQTPDTGFIDPILFDDEGHLITIAPTGAGKGVGCIVPALLRHDGPVIVIDPKGENYAITARHRRELGQKVFVLDPMGITDAGEAERARLNPLDAIDPEHPLSVDEMSSMVSGFVDRYTAARDLFWVERAKHLVLALLAHVVSDLPPERRTLKEVRDLVDASVSDPGTLSERLKRSRHPLAGSAVSMLGLNARETLGGIQSFAQEMLAFVRGPLVEQATSASSFELEAITLGEPISIYIVLPPHMLGSHGRLLRMWISALMSAIIRRRAKPDRPTLFLLDEAAQLGELRQLQQAITLLRGYGLKTWSFWQDVSQIKRNYPADWPTMINNCRVVQCFGANNMNAARDMSDLVGLGTAEGVLDLKRHEMLLQIAGDEAVYARLPNYLADPVFAGQFDANPFYDRDREIVSSATESIRWYLRPKRPWIDPWVYPPAKPDFAPNPEAKALVEKLMEERETTAR